MSADLQQTLVYMLGAFTSYLVIGFVISWFYGRRASQFFQEANKRLPHEAALGISMGCMFIAWPLMAPYEWSTNFKTWREKRCY